MHDVEIRLVKSFVAVADERSFTRAAEQLNVAQPWLSVQIRKLEDQLGFRLFERNRNQGVVPSAEAEALLPAARDYIAASERLGERVNRIRDQAFNMLRIGAPDFTADMPMRTEIIDTFAAAHPGIELEVSNSWTIELLKRIRSREIDLAFTVGPHLDDATEVLVVARYHLALLARRDEVPAAAPVPLSALKGREVGLFRRNINPHFHDSICAVLEAAGIVVQHLGEAGVPALLHYAQRAHVLSLIGDYTPPCAVPEPLVVVPLDDSALGFNLNLVRRLGDRTPTVSALWSHAARLAAHHSDLL